MTIFKTFLTAALLTATTALSAFAQTRPASSSEILLRLKKLNTTGSVLYIAAHPDDENTRLLAWLANERKVRTGYLSLTRGDGGQNLIGKEQGEMLGLIRTQELLAARRTDGAEQFFSRAFDFGFSKNPQETFSFWNKEAVLSDVVWVIRNFKPDIIICRFPTTGEGGHGHHTASAMLAEEAFKMAGDPNWFPEQLKYTEVWQPKKIFWNTFNFGGLNTTSPDQLKVDVGGFNPLLGKSYGEIAADSRSFHKSQGFGSASSRGESFEYFKQLGGTPAKKDLFEGIDLTWKRIPGGLALQQQLSATIANFKSASPEQSVPQLLNALKQMNALKPTTPEGKKLLARKKTELEQIVLACAGVWAEAAAAEPSAVPGNSMQYQVQVLLNGKANVALKQITFLDGSDTAGNMVLQTGKMMSWKRSTTLPENTAYSTPYWLAKPHSRGSFTVDDQLLIGQAENKPALYAKANFTVSGVSVSMPIPVVYKSTDPVKGEVYRPFEVLPAVTVNPQEPVHMFANGRAQNVRFTVKANANNFKGNLLLRAPKGWQASPDRFSVNLAKKGEELVLETTVSAEEGAGEGVLEASVSDGTYTYDKTIRRIDYDHIPRQFTLSQAQVKLVPVRMQRVVKNIGYIPGAGDEVAACLEQIGYHITVLTNEVFESTDLGDFDAIVTGVRAYNTNPKMQAYYQRLMQYVRKGGNLIVQYNTNNRISSVPVNIGPYPFDITRDRVTDEQAKLRFLLPNHVLLHYPNEITEKDFEGWIQERGIYFASDSLNKYEKIFGMNDPREKELTGSLIVTAYGKGNFIYTGLAFFRELPAGVPGAYRLFANLLALPPNDKNR